MELINKKTGVKKSWRYQLLAFLLISVVLGGVLFISPAGQTHLMIDFSTNHAVSSQFQIGEKGDYSAGNSHHVNVDPGRHIVNIPFKALKPTVRWDLTTSNAHIVINEIYLAVSGIRLQSVQVGLSPLDNGTAIKTNNEGLLEPMGDGADNRQLSVDFDKNKVYKKRSVICGTFGLAISFVIMLLISRKNKLNTLFINTDRALSEFVARGRSDGFNVRELGFLIFIGAVFYGYFLSTFSLSIDNEAAALRNHPFVWVGQGRWFTYLIEAFLLQQPSVPFAPYVILIIAFAASYMALLRAHGYNASWKTYLAYPVFCAFPTWWAIATFYSNTPALAIGLVFISLSAYLYFGQGFTNSISIHHSFAKTGLIIVLLACAIAAYQSLILMFVCYACGILLTRCLRLGGFYQISLKPLIMTLCKLVILVTLAIFFYELVNKLMQKYIANDSGYIAKAFFNYDKTLSDPLRVMHAILKEQLAIYGGSEKRYGATLTMNGVVIGLATLVIVRGYLFKAPAMFVLWLGVLFSPFALHLVTGGEPLPMRTLITVSYVSWLACIILLSAKRSTAMLASIILVGLLQIKIIGVTSQYIASATIVQSHDRLLAADIYSRIGELSADFDPDGPLKMDFFGRKKFSAIYANAWQGTMQGSFFSWDLDNISRVTNFMKVMGYPNIVIPGDDERKALNPVFGQMPVWPAAGSVRKVGDIYLVKLSKEPDPTHAF